MRYASLFTGAHPGVTTPPGSSILWYQYGNVAIRWRRVVVSIAVCLRSLSPKGRGRQSIPFHSEVIQLSGVKLLPGELLGLRADTHVVKNYVDRRGYAGLGYGKLTLDTMIE